MKDRDCESCKKFSRTDPYESEGYCDAKRAWVDPQEGEDCKMHEFTLHSATKYKDGTPIMTEPEKVYCDTDCTLIHGKIDRDWTSSYPKCKEDANSEYGIAVKLSNQLDSLEQRVDELSEEYDAVLKTHGDTLEQHKERITINEGNIDALACDVEDLQRKVYQIYRFLNSVDPDFFAKVQDEMAHKDSNFCGNCEHCKVEDGVAACELSGEIVDPDDSSCSMFEPPF